jgi:flagellar biosynthetic protein FliR
MSVFEFRLEQIQLFILLVTRASGVFIFTPILGTFNVPQQVRVILSIAVGYFLTLSATGINLQVPFTLGNIFIGMVEELVIGMVMGYAAYALFAALQFAGHMMGFQIGLSFVNSVDPTTSNRSTTIAVYYNFLGMMFFLGFNGHHWFIESIAKSLSIIPPYALHLHTGFLNQLMILTGKMFVVGFQVAAPVVTVLLLTDVALGIAGRTAPQIHILVIGFPLKVLVGIMCLGMGLIFLPQVLRNNSAQLSHDLNSLLHLMGR